MQWTEAELAYLIPQYRDNSFLYDRTHVDYYKNSERDSCFGDIGKDINKSGLFINLHHMCILSIYFNSLKCTSFKNNFSIFVQSLLSSW